MNYTKEKYKLTEEHRAQLKPWTEKWIANAMSTKAMDDNDRSMMIKSINGMYDAAKLKQPKNIVFVASPRMMAISGMIAAGVWYLKNNKDFANKLFYSQLSRAATREATYEATYEATDAATDAATRVATYAATYEAARAATRAATYAATYEAARAATYAATYEATYEATYAATDAATREATDAATDEATYEATYEATREATYEATRAATNAATDAATREATYAATCAATREATDAATREATREATNAATRAATDAATYEATDAATNAATDAATREATYAATCAATREATYEATCAATYEATRAATNAATREATYEATDAATNAATRAATKWLISLIKYWNNLYNGGNMWSGWASYLSFFDDVCKLDIPEYKAFNHYKLAAIHGGFRLIHKDFCMVSDRPEILLKDDKNRPHCSTGPSHRWRDGFEIYHLNGVRVPKYLVMTPESQLDIEFFKQEKNADIKAEFIRKYGVERMLSFGVKVDDYTKYSDEWWTKSEYELWDMHNIFEGLTYQPYLKMKNLTTGTWHVEALSPECRTLADAIKERLGGRKLKITNIK